MKLKEYNNKISAGPSGLDPLERESILVLVFAILGDAADIIFPAGKYKEMKWHSLRRWGKLGKLLWRLVMMVYAYAGKGR